MRSGDRTRRGALAASMLFLAGVTVLGCEPRADRIVRTRPTAELVRDYVAIGDGFTAGAQSGALSKRHQIDSYPAILAVNFVLSQEPTSAMTQPLIANPGFPITRPVVPAGYLDVVRLAPLELERRQWANPELIEDRALMHEVMELNRTQTFPFRNLGVPGLFAYDVRMAVDSLTTWTGTFAGAPNYLVETVLRDLGPSVDPSDSMATILQHALDRSPSLATVWLGMSEILDGVVRGDGTPPYDAATFAGHLGAIVDSLTAAGARVMLGDVPDVTLLPFVSALPPVVVDAGGTPIHHPTTGGMIPLLGEGGPMSDLQAGVTTLAAGSSVLLSARPAIARGAGIPDVVLVAAIRSEEGVDEATAMSLLANRYPDHGTPLDMALTLLPSERAAAVAAVDAYDAAIAELAADRGLPVAPLRTLFDRFHRGLDIGGVRLTDAFITGGLVSLDGVHPTSVGYALIAEVLAEAVNAAFGTDVPAIDVGRYLDPPELPRTVFAIR